MVVIAGPKSRRIEKLILHKMTKEQSIEAQTKPAWKDLPPEIRNAWIEQTQAFYPAGSTTLEDAAELAQSEYEQSESDSVHPPSEQPSELT